MFISKLTIQNYRNFRTFSVPLKPFTLIIGENNAGKTNLTNALSLIFTQEITAFRNRRLQIDDLNYPAIYDFKKAIATKVETRFPEVKIEIELEDFKGFQTSVVGDWFIDKELKRARLTYLFRPKPALEMKSWIAKNQKIIGSTDEVEAKIKKLDFPINDYEFFVFGGDDPGTRAEPYFLAQLKMEVLDALRDAKRELVASGDYRLLYRVLNKLDGINYSDLKEHLLGLEDLVKKNKALDDVRGAIASFLQDISLQGDKSDHQVNFLFASPEIQDILRKLGLQYGVDPISIERNGLGRNNLLYLSLVLSQLAGDGVADEKTAFRVVAIEEPEAHLHPHSQDYLVQAVKEKTRGDDLQVIVTSHSAHIAASSDLDDMVILYNDGQRAPQQHYVLSGFDSSSARGAKTIQYLKKFLDVTKSTLFFGRKVILVEGIAEQILIPALYRVHAERKKQPTNLLQLGCSVVNVAGVAFRHFLDIVKNGYFVKCVVLTDKDNDAKRDADSRADKLQSDYSALTCISVGITEQKTFELDIIAANKTGKGRELLLRALLSTRPVKGRVYVDDLKDGEIIADECFALIENHKSTFAFNVAEELTKDSTDFVIPSYISAGFGFIDGLV